MLFFVDLVLWLFDLKKCVFQNKDTCEKKIQTHFKINYNEFEFWIFENKNINVIIPGIYRKRKPFFFYANRHMWLCVAIFCECSTKYTQTI